MFSKLETFFKKRKVLRQVSKCEREIAEAIPIYRYDVEAKIRQLGITVSTDNMQPLNKTMVFVPRERCVLFHPSVTPTDRRFALTMLLCHLSLTYAGKDITKLSPYVILDADLHSVEGPADNVQWQEYMQAMELILPASTYCILGVRFYGNSTYAIMRVMEVTYETLQKRSNQLQTGLALKSPVPFSYEIIGSDP